MTYLEIFLLALIQGAAELLPVSSSAHVILAETLMGRNPSDPDLVFLLVMLHTGTMFAVLVYYWRRWAALLKPAGPSDTARPSPRQFLAAVLLATVVTGIVGLALKVLIEKVTGERMEELFKNLRLVAGALLAAGVVILIAGYREGRDESKPLSWATALCIGLIQGLSLPFRGFSRSGVTISMGMFRGVSRHLAEEFSFALAVLLTPPVIAYSAYGHMKRNEWPSGDKLVELLTPGLVGMVLSCLAGLVALRLLSAMLDKGKWKFFGYYCLVAALVMFGVAWMKG